MASRLFVVSYFIQGSATEGGCGLKVIEGCISSSCTLKTLLKMHSIWTAIWIIRYVQSVGETEKNNHYMRKCSHLKCTGVRKKENDFLFKATWDWEKCWKINLFSKEWVRLFMHLLVPLALFRYNVDALIFMHMWYVFFLYRKYGVHKRRWDFFGLK